MGIEKPGNAAAEEIRQLRSPGKRPRWFQGMGRVSFFRIQPRKPAVQIGAPWILEGNKLNMWTQLHRYATTAIHIYVWSTWEPSSVRRGGKRALVDASAPAHGPLQSG